MRKYYALKTLLVSMLLMCALPGIRANHTGKFYGNSYCVATSISMNGHPEAEQPNCTEPDLPTNVIVFPTAIVCGETAYLTAVSAGNRIKWFTSPTGGVEIGSSLSGLAFPVTPMVSTVYYAEAYNTTCTNHTRVPVSLSVSLPAAPTAASANPTTINCGQYSELSATTDGSSIAWYSSASGGTPVGTSINGSVLAVSPESTTTYYAETTGLCASATRSVVEVTVNSAPDPAPVTAYPATVCYGSTTALTAFAPGYTIQWYDAVYGGNYLASTSSGSDLTATVYSDTTLYAETYFSNTGSASFMYTGNIQTWTVPAGVTSVDVLASGAQGGNNGGTGARLQTRLSVVPGSVLYINVGGQGGTPTPGWNGGGTGGTASSGHYHGGGGGGATDIRIGSNALTNRVIIAAGGGGKGGRSLSNPVSGDGGNASGEQGSNGINATNSCLGSHAGTGASQLSGGNGGQTPGCGCIFAGSEGGFGFGGNGAPGISVGQPGGGGAGGAGYFGGGGAGCTGSDTCAATDLSGAGGGAGSCWTDPQFTTSTTYLAGGRTGNGQIDLSWTSPTCISASRTPVFVPFSRYTEPGGVSGGGKMCPGNPADTLRLTSYTGTVINWEVSTNNGASWTTITNSQPYYVPSITDGGTYWYRAIVKSGNCPEMPSSYTEVTVPEVNGIAMHTGTTGSCNIMNTDSWVLLINNADQLIASLLAPTGSNLSETAHAYLQIDPNLQQRPDSSGLMLQRHVKIETGESTAAKVKLYFTQQELDALVAADPSVTNAWDLCLRLVADSQSWAEAKLINDPILTENDPFPGVYSLEADCNTSGEFFIHAKTKEIATTTSILSVEVSCMNGMAVVNWITASESENKNFIIERTTDLSSWSEVAVIEGAGNSSSVKSYEFIDESGIKGAVYYRIRYGSDSKQMQETAAVPVNCDFRTELTVNYYPNPFNNELMVAFNKDLEKLVQLMMVDASGKVVLVRLLTDSEMKNGITVINTSGIVQGIYTIEFMSGQLKNAATIIKN